MDNLNLSNYEGNSRSRPPTSRPKISPVIATPPTLRQKTWMGKLKDYFLVQDAHSVTSMVFRDVVIPKIKEMFLESLNEGATRAMWGYGHSDRSRYTGRGGGGGGYVSYNRPNQPVPQRHVRAEEFTMSDRERANHDFSRLVFTSAGEAENVADKLISYTREYGTASVADLYDAMGIKPEFTDDAFGWTNLESLKVRRVPGGYILDAPRPIQLSD